MKSIKLKMAAMVFAATLNVMSSCKKDETITPTPAQEDLLLSGELTSNRTLSAGLTYQLSGGYHVKAGAILTIEAGTKIVAIDDNIVDYILIEQNAKIIAQGTALNPIVMTSERKEYGAWGGLHICGNAPINVSGTAISEIGDAPYGGSNAGDNSGIMKYIRIEYAGYSFSEEKEANGFTFYGVGNGTTIDYCQAYMGSDDGFEWFGGTVNVKHLISTGNSDDSFDWTQGWTGKAQFLVAYQPEESVLGYDCDALIEADNNADNFVASPIAHPILANLTLIGNNSTNEKRGIRLRAGTEAEIYNALVKGKVKCITTQTSETESSLVNGTSILEYIYLENTVVSEDGGYSEELFLANGTNAVNQEINFSGNYLGVVNGGKVLTDSFFENAAYIGAVKEDNDWTSGWSL